ncbi:glycosyltransferase family 4 protein [Christiangramia crocea]|uniref:Glycosyltransferase n=1 Tax=Christiangramia crocea TaxID=2904124 RepID=A0A9X1UZ20_9FLAO|nr:glycosyltransferase [Gramella crocea]MCG9973042.1 glycosyltransferase [Gramella crocea]
MKFAIFTHVIHHKHERRYYAYGPYVREINLWLRYVDEVHIVAPLSKTSKTRDLGEDYIHHNLNFIEISTFNLLNLLEFLKALVKIPVNFYKIIAAMRQADHLHIRCPGNIGLLAVIAQIFFPKKSKTVKYAGNWDPGARQPWTYNLQKWILSNTFLSRNIKVLVYGEWKNQTRNIVPFFTASFSEEERETVLKEFKPPFQFIYSGNMVEGKGLKETIGMMKSLRELGLNCKLDIYGDGVMENRLMQMVQELELDQIIVFKGRANLGDLKQAYRKAHFSVLLSKSEGWPKAIAEAMFFGCVPIGTSVSCVRWMMGEGERGIIINNPEGNRVAKKISKLLTSSGELVEKSRMAQQWSQIYTTEKFSSEIKKML